MECKFCGKFYKTAGNKCKHEKHCDKNPNKEPLSEKWLQSMHNMNRDFLQKSDTFTCRFCGCSLNTTKSGFANHEASCEKNPNKRKGAFAGLKHSEETKKKISDGCKKAHDEGRGHTWTNRYKNPSYAEQWLYGFLDANNIKYEKEVPFKGFFLDVVVGNKVVEIDGEQHYDATRFPEQIERDKRKDQLLKENGFEELRLRWSLVQSDKISQIKILKSFLNI